MPVTVGDVGAMRRGGLRNAGGMMERSGGRGTEQLAALARELAPLGPPVIVFNKSHSGSRLLARTLAAAGVFMGARRNESEDALELMPLLSYVVHLHHPDFSRLWTDGDPLLIRRARDAVARHLVGRPAGARWGWKLCETTFILPVLARIFPDAWYVHLLRDGRDVAFSEFVAPDNALLRKVYFGTDAVNGFRGLALSEAGYRSAPHLFNARAWVEAVVAGRQYGAMLGERYREVRYEALVADLPGTARALCDFLRLAPPADAFDALAAEAHDRAIGRHRTQPPEAVAEASEILGTTLAAFGYGDVATAPRDDGRSISVVLLDAADDTSARAAALARTLDGLRHGGPVAFDVVLASAEPPPADPAMPVRHVPVAPDAGEAAAAAAGLQAASGTHVVFGRVGYRLILEALVRLAARVDTEGAIAGFGCLRSTDAEGKSVYTPILQHQGHLRWLDAVPLGAAMFRRDAMLASGAAARIAADGERWHWRLVRRMADRDLVVLGTLPLSHVRELPAVPAVPTVEIVAEDVSADHADDLDDRRVIVCGTPDPGLGLLFDGLPDRLRRHLRFLPHAASPRDLTLLVGAGAVVLLRDFQLPLATGVVDALRRMEVPFFYMADDHFPTLCGPSPDMRYYSSGNLATLLALADGAIAPTPDLVDAFRPHCRRVLLWPQVVDESLVPPATGPAYEPPARRIGMMGGSFRAEAFLREVRPALERLAAERPLTLVAREDLLVRAPGRAALHALPLEPAFRRFVFLWRRAQVDTVVHPRAVTADAPCAGPSALLTALYLGALPIVPDEPAHGGVGIEDGVTVAAAGDAGWHQALVRTADPAEREILQARLRAYCRRRFAPDAAAAALAVVLDAARPPDARQARSRLAWLSARPTLASLARHPDAAG
ncbi:MAG: sulfotransferase [Alphaproteobacteria bacterium]|nr:sulfotransferase [Alphaproteobacteria bacterium]